MTIKDRFVKTLLPEEGPPKVSATLPATATLKDMAAKAAELCDRSPPATLPEERRAVIARDLSRLVVPALERCAEGLQSHPEITQELGVSAASCLSAAQVLSSAAKLAKNAGDAFEGSADGLRLVAGESQSLGEEALFGVFEVLKTRDPNFDLVVLDTAFSDAFRKYQETADRDRRLKNYRDQTAASDKARAQEARQRAQESAVIDRFVNNQKKE